MKLAAVAAAAALLGGPIHLIAFELPASYAQARRELRNSLQSATQSASALMRTSLENEKVDILNELVDRISSQEDAVVGAARSVYSQVENEYLSMALFLKHEGDPATPSEFLSSRLAAAAEGKAKLDKFQPGYFPNSQTDQGDFSASLRQAAGERIKLAKASLAEADSKLESLKDSLDTLQSKFRRAASLKEDAAKSVKDLDKICPPLQAALKEAKPLIDALKGSSEPELRTKAGQQIEQIGSLVRDLFQASEIISDRTESFESAWKDFQTAKKDFTESEAVVDAKLREYRRSLDAALDAIYKIRSNP